MYSAVIVTIKLANIMLNSMYCDLHGRIKETAEALHHALHVAHVSVLHVAHCHWQRALRDLYCTLPLATCLMRFI